MFFLSKNKTLLLLCLTSPPISLKPFWKAKHPLQSIGMVILLLSSIPLSTYLEMKFLNTGSLWKSWQTGVKVK